MIIFLTENTFDSNAIFTLDKLGVYEYIKKRIPFFKENITDLNLTKNKSEVNINFKKIIKFNNSKSLVFDEKFNHIDLIVDIVVNQNIKQFYINITPILELHGKYANTFAAQAKYSKFSDDIKLYFKSYYDYSDGDDMDSLFNLINKKFYEFEEKFDIEPAY